VLCRHVADYGQLVDLNEGVRAVTKDNHTASGRNQSARPLPVTPSDQAERPDGLAFDVDTGADLSGVPAGDQAPSHPGAAHTQQVVRETGRGVGLAVPGDPDRSGQPVDDKADGH
jgi:hypothetical protein